MNITQFNSCWKLSRLEKKNYLIWNPGYNILWTRNKRLFRNLLTNANKLYLLPATKRNKFFWMYMVNSSADSDPNPTDRPVLVSLIFDKYESQKTNWDFQIVKTNLNYDFHFWGLRNFILYQIMITPLKIF